MNESVSQQSIQKPLAQPGGVIYNDPQISERILSVQSKFSTDTVPIKTIDPETGKAIVLMMQVPTRYKEILTDDVSTAFCDPLDLSVMRSHEILCSMIKSFGDSCGFKKEKDGSVKIVNGMVVKNLDLSESYNLVADYHNGLLVSSKSTGEAARTAKSQYFRQEQKGFFESREEHRRKKFLGLF